MNKYQEAFEEIKNVVVFNKNFNYYANDLRVVQELVDKEIPLRPNKQYEIDWGMGNAGECSDCKNLVNYQNSYCDKCGQRVLWED